MRDHPTLILASASLRRAELLQAAGIPFEVCAADIDETPWKDEQPEAHVRRLATAKAEVVHARRPGRTILAADTIVVFDGQILGKPRDARDAERMLGLLSGARHTVLTGIAVILDGVTRVAVETTDVWFAELSTAEIAAYVESGEPMDKAGAYAVQGQASRFVERIEGMYSNVVGLPVARVYRMLADAGWMQYS
jgi:septum formation protein